MIGVHGGVGSNAGAPSSDGLVGYLSNQGGILVQSLTAALSDGQQYPQRRDRRRVVPKHHAGRRVGVAGRDGWCLKRPVQQRLGISRSTRRSRSWLEQQVAAPFVLAAVNRCVASIPQEGSWKSVYLIHDASPAGDGGGGRQRGGAGDPAAWANSRKCGRRMRRGLAQARANGNGQAYAINAVLNAGTLGLYGDVQSFGAALQKSLATGDASALSSWAGGTLIDVAKATRWRKGVLGELQATAAEVN